MSTPDDAPSSRALKPDEAKSLFRDIVADGDVGFTEHARQELANHDMATSDAVEAMKCAECGGPQVAVDRNAVIRYDMGGLHHVVLRGVEIARCKSCGEEETTIPRIGQLHRAVADYLIRQPRLLAGAEIRFLRKHLGLSTDDFARIMGVTRETVSRWENGTAMGAPSDHLLRALVSSHEPSVDYALDDLLKGLPEKLPETKPAPFEMRNRRQRWEAAAAGA